MNAQKFTQKSLEAIQRAQALAVQYGNMHIDQAHLLYALADQQGGLVPELLKNTRPMLPGARRQSTSASLAVCSGMEMY